MVLGKSRPYYYKDKHWSAMLKVLEELAALFCSVH